MKIPSQLLWLALFLFAISSLALAQRSSFGEACSTDVRCDRRSWLGCFNGTCDCLKPDEMIYDSNIKKCVSRAGEMCKYPVENLDGSEAFEVADCANNSYCSGGGYCVCADDFLETSNGTCSPAKRYSEACDVKAKCSQSLGLLCNNGTCDCDPTLSVYSNLTGNCVGLAGQNCITNTCVEDAGCFKGKCVCEGDFYQKPAGNCTKRLDLNASCTESKQCQYNGGFTLKCINGTCQCDPEVSVLGTVQAHKPSNSWSCWDNSFHGFAGEPKTQCVGKANLPCIEGLCAAGSYCPNTPKSCGADYKTCRCQNYLYPSPFGTCGKPHGQVCETAGSCFEGLVCNQTPTDLFYASGTCTCRYSIQNYDSEAQQCVSPAGGPCDTYTGCADGAECKLFPGSTKGRCTCKTGYEEGIFGECSLTFGMSCSNKLRCDIANGLQCLDGICQCSDFKGFSSTPKRCVGLVGSQCQPGQTNDCTENAECLGNLGDGNIGRCSCNSGYSISVNYTCEAEKKFQTS